MIERRLHRDSPDCGDQQADPFTEISVFESDIETQQVELIYQQAPVSIIGALILTVLVVIGLWPVAGHQALQFWFAAHVVQSLTRLILVALYRRSSDETRQRPVWMILFFAGTFVSGVVWGCIGLIFDFAWPVEYQTLALISLAGVLAGAISAYAVNLTVYIAFMVPAILIPAQFMLVYSDRLQNNLGLMMMLFAAGLLMIARNYNRHAVHMLQLRQANDSLLDEMRRTNLRLEQEISERRSVEKSLRSDQQLFANGPVVMFRWSATRGWPIEFASRTVDQFGYDADDLVQRGVNFADLIHPADLQRVEESEFFTGRSDFESVTIDYRLLGADGSVHWVYDYTIPVRDDDGELTFYLGYLLDITDRKCSEIELQQAKERAQVTLHSIADAVITTDVNGQIEYMNPSAEALTGLDNLVARGMPVSKVFRLVAPEPEEEASGNAILSDPVSRSLLRGETIESEGDTVLRRHDGEMFSIRYSISPILSVPGSALGAILVFHDVTQARKLERTISYQATHDALTGLWNRREFEAQLDHAIAAANQAGEVHVVCTLDIDKLKVINETCSHEAGDRLVRQIADLLRGSLRDSDVVARLGGDEFGMLMKNCTLVSAARLIEDVMVALHALRFTSSGRVFEINASIGIAQIKPGCESTTHIMSEADLALHAAKERGGNRYHIYQLNDAELQRRQAEMQWVSRVSEAIDSDRLVLYCQEIMPLSPSALDGLHIEVLVRMLDTDGSVITPDKFLPAAERFNLIQNLDRWVVSHALAWYAACCESGKATANDIISINLSGKSITDAKVLSHIKTEIRKYGITAGRLCFEITETAAVSNLSAATNFIRELRRQGCRFALDDFGSGLSSFAYLKHLPVDFLKIDGAFVQDMDSDEVDFAMVSAIQQLGKVLGTRTIAEFVRNDAILHLLREMGVDYAQGYAVAKPVALASIEPGTRQSA
jgi:diguanylate cyclase (GGDEF)-like protein/PAS domain S-box-containing protein